MSSGKSTLRQRQHSSSRITRPLRAPVVPVETAISESKLTEEQDIDITTDENHNLNETMDANDISNASSIEPTSESADDTTMADESFRVNYIGGPSEVVVHGQNVSKIRVKFPPQPPPFDDSSSRSARRRHRSSMDRNKKQSKKEEEYENIPFSKEESSPHVNGVCVQTPAPLTSYPVLPNVPNIDTNIYASHSSGSGVDSSFFHTIGDVSNRSEGITLIPVSSSTDLEVERRMKDGILVGLEYFEKKNKELREIKNRLIHELDRVVKVNSDLQQRIDSLSKRLNSECTDNDELKVKLDQIEKENARLQDQAMSEWTSRVKTEEMYAHLSGSSQAEIKTIRTQLDAKDSEMKALKMKLEAMGPSSSSDDREMMLELHTKLASFKEDVRRLTSDNEFLEERNNKTTAELENIKRQVSEKNAELERQFNRFLSLKKSFNDVVEENERLKHQHKPQRGKAMNAANVTWPRDGNQTGNDTTDGETLRRLDLPPAVGAKAIRTSPVTGIGPKAMKTAFGPTSRHRRQGSDARSDNLPPVGKKDGRRA